MGSVAWCPAPRRRGAGARRRQPRTLSYSHANARAFTQYSNTLHHNNAHTPLYTHRPQGVEVTGLGARVADLCIWGLGRSALGLAYALALAELALALCMPSTTARAAGVFVPVITSLARSFDSHPRGSCFFGGG